MAMLNERLKTLRVSGVSHMEFRYLSLMVSHDYDFLWVFYMLFCVDLPEHENHPGNRLAQRAF